MSGRTRTYLLYHLVKRGFAELTPVKSKAGNDFLVDRKMRKQAAVLATHSMELQLMRERAVTVVTAETAEGRETDLDNKRVIEELRAQVEEWECRVNSQPRDVNN